MATDPLQGGPTPSPNPGADPVNQLAPKPAGQPSHDDHDTSGPPAPEVVARGYEEDVYDAKTVLSVPLLVIFFFVAAFGITTVVFMVVAPHPSSAVAHPQAKARNDADLNARLGRIGRGKEVDQPRLEPLRLRQSGGKLDQRAITRPEVTDRGANSPEYHPEDLIPDPNNGDHAPLFTTGKDRVGLDKTLTLGDEALKGLFKAAPGAGPLVEDAPYSSYSGSDAGHRAERARAPQPEPKVTGPKAGEPKKEVAPAPKGGKP